MSMLRALSSMGSFAGGFMEGLDDNERRARRKKLEEQQSEVQALQLEGLKAQAQDQKDLRLATAPVVAEVNAPGDGMGPSANMVGAMGGPKTAYGTSPEQTQQAASMVEAMNKPEAVAQRRDAVLMRTPEGEEKALRLSELRRSHAKAIETEGAMDFVNQNFQAAPSIEDIEAGKAGTFQLNGIEGFNKTGKLKIPEGAVGKWQVLDLGNGRKVADFMVVGADGKPLSPMSGRTMEAIHGMSLKEREALADSRVTQGRTLTMNEGIAKDRSALLAAQADAASARAEATMIRLAGGGGRGGQGAQPQQGDPMAPPDFGKLSDDLVKDWAKQQGGGDLGGGKPPTTREVAAKRIEIETELRGRWVDQQASTIVGRELRAASADPAAYKQTYEKAKSAGFTDQMLAGMGFAAPKTEAPPKTSSAAQQPPASAPAPARASMREAAQPTQAVRRAQLTGALPDKVVAAQGKAQARKKAMSDPTVTKLKAAVDGARSGRERRTAEASLRAHLTKNYQIDSID